MGGVGGGIREDSPYPDYAVFFTKTLQKIILLSPVLIEFSNPSFFIVNSLSVERMNIFKYSDITSLEANH
ncbi:hypothetical protein [Leptothoe sp. PORK10 BA2]|uniref:hypothetical protein n=1 Tax=Leptothoe sp. PORK10 BA2 TaxID=3110254 RepID=UPI002B20DADD|nr:hypothetical protein [Leptothoe sp. PORK10 BA2]